MIQEGFDRGYQVGALFSALKVLEGAFLNSELYKEHHDDLEEDEILREIAGIRETLQERVPEIKIALNLFK